MGDNCCGCDFRDDCDKSEEKKEPTEECVCEKCGCDPCECEDADDKKGEDKEEKQFRNITKIPGRNQGFLLLLTGNDH